VPETKYSSVMYGKLSTVVAPGTMLIAGLGYIMPGPVMGAEFVGV
jgi:hypothetical protein